MRMKRNPEYLQSSKEYWQIQIIPIYEWERNPPPSNWNRWVQPNSISNQDTNYGTKDWGTAQTDILETQLHGIQDWKTWKCWLMRNMWNARHAWLAKPDSKISQKQVKSTHIDGVTILGYISFTMLDTVILFIVHDVDSFQVFIGKDIGAHFKVAAQKKKRKKKINSDKLRQMIQ